jgi:hypothetical protein
MGKSVKVHVDTHSALKALKARKRSASFDQVIREMIRETTGFPVGEVEDPDADKITRFLDE